jgi:phosphoglycerol geranylgeranyltransferase
MMNILKNWLQKKANGQKSLAILVDPDKISTSYLETLAQQAQDAFVDYFFVGGSLITTNNLDKTIQFLKANTQVPVILFPGSTLQINTKADAILFLSLISGRNPELLIGKHVEAAPVLAASNLEIIATGYIIVESGKATAASYMSNTRGIPYDKPEIAACTALAGSMLGLQCMYLEAGSGAVNPVSNEMVKQVAATSIGPLIVGGGIRDKETASVICQAGADIIVVGTSIENNPLLIQEIYEAIQNVKSIGIES